MLDGSEVQPDLADPLAEDMLAGQRRRGATEDARVRHLAILQRYAADVTSYGLFGCLFEFGEDETWWHGRAVHIMHIRFGPSIGFTSRRVCSVCELDAGECDHIPGMSYPTARPFPEHVVAKYVMRDLVMHETTLTPRPRDPLARITSVSVEPEFLSEFLGRPPRADDRITSFDCVYPCSGFETTSLDELFRAAS